MAGDVAGVKGPVTGVATSGPATITGASGTATYAPGPSPTSQAASVAAPGNRQAGRDTREISVPVTATGSGWPLVAAIGLVAAGLVAWQWCKGRVLRGNAVAVAGAIRDIGPGPQRDRLIGRITNGVPHPEAWDKLVRAAKVRVRRRQNGDATA